MEQKLHDAIVKTDEVLDMIHEEGLEAPDVARAVSASHGKLTGAICAVRLYRLFLVTQLHQRLRDQFTRVGSPPMVELEGDAEQLDCD